MRGVFPRITQDHLASEDLPNAQSAVGQEYGGCENVVH